MHTDRFTILQNLYAVNIFSPIPVAVRSNAWFCGRSLSGVVGSISSVEKDVSLMSAACCQVGVSATG
jgi:hypothetical protein